MGEDPTVDLRPGEVRFRFLTNFSIFDPAQDGEFVGLDDLPQSAENGGRKRSQAMGDVTPIYEEEDAGQDSDYLANQEGASAELQSLRTGDIKLLSINYAEEDG